MRTFQYVAAACAMSLLLAGCGVTPVKESHEATLKSGPLDMASAPALIRSGATASVLYFSPENHLVLRDATGAEQILAQGNEKEFRNSYVASYGSGTNVHVVWRTKLINRIEGVGIPGDKVVYIRSSQDGGRTFGPVHRLNQKGGAFKPAIAGNANGDAYLIWTDERNSGTAHEIYLNFTNDNGITWKNEDVKITGAETTLSANPSLVVEGSNVYVSWLTKSPGIKKFRMFVRASHDRGATWAAPVIALETEKQPGTPVMARAGNRLVLCWTSAGEARCRASSDQGKTWGDELAVPDSAHSEALYLETDPMSRAHLLLLKKNEDDRSRHNLFHAVSSHGSAFSSLHRLTGGQEPYRASSVMPGLAFGDQGSIFVTWMDMRYLRPTIEAAYSPDGGKSWLPNSIVLGGGNNAFSFFPVAVGLPNDNFKAAWVESASRTATTTNVVLASYKPGDKGVSMPIPDVSRLKTRVDQFWSLREQGKWAEIYDFMDPFYRDSNPREAYVKSQGSVKYYSHSLAGEPSISTVRANVPVKYTSEVPEMILQGKKISVPKTEAQIAQEWVWVDGEWYVIFMDIMGGTFLLD